MSKTQLIFDFIERQYVTGDGDVRANVEALFSPDLKYHVDGEKLTREDLVDIGVMVRSSPRTGRRVEASGFGEDEDAVHWHLSATLPGMGEGGSDAFQESDVSAWFTSDGMIHTVRSTTSATTN